MEHEQIVRAKVHLQRENPFFSYLVMNLKIVKDNENCESCSVDGKGNLYYNSKWVNKLDFENLKSVITHECLHLVLEHFQRRENKEHEVYNIATDLVINAILINNNFRLPQGLVPYNNNFEFKDTKGNILFTIEDLDKKSADEVYNELMKHQKKKDEKDSICLVGKSRFDKHIYNKKGKGNGKDEQKENQENKKKWKKIFSEASVYAKNQGKLPSGIDRLIDIVLNEKVSWKHILYKYITNEIMTDFSYNRPSRRSRATGIFMPSIKKENIEIVIAIDTSGSIGQEELSDFLSEIVGIAKSFSNIDMKIIICDSEIQDVFEVKNGSIDTIMNLKICGGGGTSHIPIYNYVKENLPNTKFIINFTDGYTNFPSEEEVKTIWVLTKNSCRDDNIPFGDIVRLD